MKRIIVTLSFCFLFIIQINGKSQTEFRYNKSNYHSQSGPNQDRWLNEHVFKNKKPGTFLDVGAHNGVRFSNTYFYEKELGWKGICIEPHPIIFEQLIKNRDCICINGCVSSISGLVDFLQIDNDPIFNTEGPDMLSGILQNYEEKHKKRIQVELGRDGGFAQIIKVNSYLLNDILSAHQIYHIDFFSLDTEGSELDILKSINYRMIDIDIICVENNYCTDEIYKFLITKGFSLIACLDHDEIYRNIKYIAPEMYEKSDIGNNR